MKQSEPAKHLYEYAVLRYVPRVEREEFINVGLVMMCKRRRWLHLEYRLDPAKMDAFKAQHTIEELSGRLDCLRSVALGKGNAGPIAQLEAEERFRWIAAVKSSCLQVSRPHPGLCEDLDSTFSRIFEEQV